MGFRVKGSPARSSPARRKDRSEKVDVKEQLNLAESVNKKDSFRVSAYLPGAAILFSVVLVVVLLNISGVVIRSKQEAASAVPDADANAGSNPADTQRISGTVNAVSGDSSVDVGVTTERLPDVATRVTLSPPYLPDFDTSRPVEGNPVSQVLSREEKQLRRAEAQYQMRLTKRLELMGGQRPDFGVSSPRWKAGKIKEVLLSPTYPCARPERVGSGGNGGKWMCDVKKLRKKGRLIVYSLGNAGNLGFEEAAFKRLKNRPFVFDPKPQGSERQYVKSRQFIKYLPYGVGAERQLSALKRAAPAGQTWRYYTLAQVMAKLNHSHVDAIKIDCDRCEERLIPEWLMVYGKDNAPVTQIMLQVHQIRHVGKTASVLFSLEDMGYRLFYSEASPQCPTCYDLSFVHESFLKPTPQWLAA